MSEPRDSNDSDQEMLELSDEEHEQIDAEGEDSEFPLTEGDPLEEQNPHLHAEGDLGSNGFGLVETPIKANPSENLSSDAGVPSESQEGTEIPATNLVENDSDQNDDSDVKTAEEECNLDKEQLENGNKLVDTDAKEVHLEEHRFDETPLKEERDESHETLVREEGAGGDYPKPTEAPVQSFNFDPFLEGGDDGAEEMQAAFMRELENFHKERSLEFKPPKFYGEGLNCLKYVLNN